MQIYYYNYKPFHEIWSRLFAILITVSNLHFSVNGLRIIICGMFSCSETWNYQSIDSMYLLDFLKRYADVRERITRWPNIFLWNLQLSIDLMYLFDFSRSFANSRSKRESYVMAQHLALECLSMYLFDLLRSFSVRDVRFFDVREKERVFV